MSFNINNVYAEKPYPSLISPKYLDKIKDTPESKDNNKDMQKLHKKKQVISEKEGNYYCTYLVDEEGQKILLNKVPIAQAESSNELTNKEKNPHLCTTPMKFVEEGNSGVYEEYIGGIKIDENFMDIGVIGQKNASNATQIESKINKLYYKTDAEKLKEIFRL